MARYTTDILNVTGENSMPSPDLSTNQETIAVWGQDLRVLLLSLDNEVGLTIAGNPNGSVESRFLGRRIWDTDGKQFWICTTVGTPSTAVWESMTVLIAAQVNAVSEGAAVALAIALG